MRKNKTYNKKVKPISHLYIKSLVASVRLTRRSVERFLWRNWPQRFSMAEPATETMTTGYQRPRS